MADKGQMVKTDEIDGMEAKGSFRGTLSAHCISSHSSYFDLMLLPRVHHCRCNVITTGWGAAAARVYCLTARLATAELGGWEGGLMYQAVVAREGRGESPKKLPINSDMRLLLQKLCVRIAAWLLIICSITQTSIDQLNNLTFAKHLHPPANQTPKMRRTTNQYLNVPGWMRSGDLRCVCAVSAELSAALSPAAATTAAD